MSFQTEFPDYPVSDMPAIPEGFEDSSWHNDACPNIADTARGLRVWIDYADPALREHGGSRFIVERCDSEGTFQSSELESDDWNAVLAFIATDRR